MSGDVEALVREGRIEAVEADTQAALDKLKEAKRHLRSASLIGGGDPQGSYALLYDAARKAIDAHMLAAGYRVNKSRPGAHEATARYAVAVFAEAPRAEHAQHLDRMRRNRNRSEYGVWHVGRSTLRADLGHARGIVRAVEESLT